MPRGDKSSYTDKQKRKARAHRGRLREARRLRATRPSGAPGPPSTRKPAAATRAAPAAAAATTSPPRAEAVGLGGRAAARPSGSGAFPIGEKGRGHAQTARGVPLSTVLQSSALRDAGRRILDQDAGVRRSVLLHQRKQHRRIGRMQPHATLRSARAKLRDRRGAMDGVVAAVEDRIWHRRIVEDRASDDCATVFAADTSRSACRQGRSTPAKCSDARRSPRQTCAASPCRRSRRSRRRQNRMRAKRQPTSQPQTRLLFHFGAS